MQTMWIPELGVIVVGILIGISCCAVYYLKREKTQKRADSGIGRPASRLKERQANREMMLAFNGPRLGPLILSGKCWENGDGRPITYIFNILPDATFSGSSTDDTGTSVVNGKICIPEGGTIGIIAWRETRQGVSMEASGTIDIRKGQAVVRASYVSGSRGAQGSVEVSGGTDAEPGLQQGQICSVEVSATDAELGLRQGHVFNAKASATDPELDLQRDHIITAFAAPPQSHGQHGAAQVVPIFACQAVGVPVKGPMKVALADGEGDIIRHCSTASTTASSVADQGDVIRHSRGSTRRRTAPGVPWRLPSRSPSPAEQPEEPLAWLMGTDSPARSRSPVKTACADGWSRRTTADEEEGNGANQGEGKRHSRRAARRRTAP